jgi:hypothetical protein
MRFHHSKLPLVDHRTHISLAVQSVSHTQPFRLLNASAKKLWVQTAMHVTTLHRQASLASIHKGSPHCRARSHVHIGVIEHQHWIFSTKFQHHGQQPLRRGRRDALTSRHASGKDQFVNL